MGFLTGRMTFERYWITNDPTPALGPDHLEQLEKHKISSSLKNALEHPNVGFLAGAHLLDTKFSLEKNILGDVMHFGVRIDSDQIPSAVRNAWMQMELLPMTVDNPSGKATKSQREEAKEAVEARCMEEAATGKFRRMQQVPVLWDALNEVMYIGTTSTTGNDLCVDLLERAFDVELERVTSSKLATAFATDRDMLQQLHAVNPAVFQGEETAGIVAWWNGMADNFEFLGNEFLLWLWWKWETESDTLSLGDDSEVSGMFARTLALDCPIGETGKETISAESPVALPEAALAIQSGKLPRKAGLTLVRHGEQYDFSLQAEAFTVGGAKMTSVGNDDDPENPHEARIESLRGLTETLDLLFDAFCDRRLGKPWKDELKRLRKWLQTDGSTERRSAA